MAAVDNAEIEALIREAFERNYERIRAESGGALAPETKQAALDQVLLYWRKLRDVAERITETEVRLNLPQQRTPNGREFAIEGVVDIVRDDDCTIMYDIKTHDAEYVRANCNIYEEQLNVYAHIWSHLRGQPLDQTAVIATDFPVEVKEALASGDPARLARTLEDWEPVVDIPFSAEKVEATIRAFGEVVDAIEAGAFAPPPVERLKERADLNSRRQFATRVCINCDARFSCDSFRAYAAETTSRDLQRDFLPYFVDLETDLEREARFAAGLAASTDETTLF